MTGFDNIMRSQGMVEQSAQHSDQRRDSAMQDQGQALMWGVESIRQGQQMRMQEQQLQAEMGALQQRLAMEQAESGMALQQHQQQLQLNAVKLQTMMAVDQADGSRLAVKSAQLDYDMRKLEYDKALKAHKSQDQERSLLSKTVQDWGGIDEVQAAGWVPDQATNGLRRMTREERDDYAKTRQQMGTARGANSTVNQDRLLLAQQIKTLEEAGDYDGANQLKNQLLALPLAGGQPGGSRQIQQQSQPVILTPKDRELAGELEQIIAPSAGVQEMVGRMGEAPGARGYYGGLSKESSDRVTSWLVSNRQAIHDRLRNARTSEGRQYLGETPEESLRKLAAVIRNPNDPARLNILRMLQAAGTLTDADLQRMVGDK